MHIPINREDSESLISQIVSGFQDRIRSNMISPGQKLPSVRQLAKQLHVSQMTVVNAYHQLQAEGWIVQQHGKGTYVQSNIEDRSTPNEWDWQGMLVDYVPRAQFHKTSRLLVPDQLISLSFSSLHPDLLPSDDLIKGVQEELIQNPSMLLSYGNVQGEEQVRNIVGDYLNQNPKEIILTGGSQQAINLCARTFIGSGDVVFMEAPTYPAAIDVFRVQGARIIQIPADNKGIRFNELIKLCDKVTPKLFYIIPSFHNPTGRVMSEAEREKLLHIAESYQCLILEDDPWSDIYYNGPPPVPIYEMDKRGTVIYIKGFSKTIAPGARISTLSAKGRIFDRLLAMKSLHDSGTSLLSQYTLASYLRSGLADKNFSIVREKLRQRLKIALNTLDKCGPCDLKWGNVEGGLNIWLTLPKGKNADEVVRKSYEKGVSVLSGTAFFPNEVTQQHIRMTFSYTSIEDMKTGIKILCDTVM